MSQWLIEYWGKHGRVFKVIDSPSGALARRALGLPESRIIRTQRRWQGRWHLSSLAYGDAKPSHQTQMLFLVRALAMYSGVGRVSINDLIQEFGVLKRIAKREPHVLREDLELSRQLSYLKFDAVIVSLVQVGERTGHLESSLKMAIEYIRQREKVRSSTSSKFILAFVLFAVSVVAFFVVPVALGNSLQGLIDVRGIQIELTPVTHLMLWINSTLRENLLFFGFVLAGAIVVLWLFREEMSAVWPLNMWHRVRCNQRSVRLMMVWSPYHISGLVLEKEPALLQTVLGKAAARDLIPQLSEGASISDIVTPQWFSPVFAHAVRGLNNIALNDFKRIGGIILEALIEENNIAMSRLAAAFYIIGALATIGIVAMVAFGLIFPILGASANV